MEPLDRVRSFVAVLLDERTRETLGARAERLRALASGVAWVAPQNLHVTVKFLGAVDAPRLELVRAALDRAVADVRPFALTVEGLGAFPSPTRPRVLWAGIDAGAPEVTALAARVEHELAAIGFAADERPFTAHVTLGRVREPRRNERLAEALGRARDERFGELRVQQLSLMRSELSPRGARHTELSAHALA